MRTDGLGNRYPLCRTIISPSATQTLKRHKCGSAAAARMVSKTVSGAGRVFRAGVLQQTLRLAYRNRDGFPAAEIRNDIS